MNLFADNSLKGGAPRYCLVGSLHNQPEIIQLVSQLDRDTVFFCVARFSPVKRGTEEGTAGTACKAGVGGFHNWPVGSMEVVDEKVEKSA